MHKCPFTSTVHAELPLSLCPLFIADLGHNRDGTTPGPCSMGTPAAAIVQPPSQAFYQDEQQLHLTFATTDDVVEIPLEKTHRKMAVKKAHFINEDADIKVAAICSELGLQTDRNKDLDDHLKGQLSEAVKGRYKYTVPVQARHV